MKKMLAICCAMLLTACVAFSGCAKDEPATTPPTDPGVTAPDAPDAPDAPAVPDAPETE